MGPSVDRRTFLRHTGYASAGVAAAAAGLLPAGRASAKPARVRNLPASFYERPGLEGMPRIDWESMPVANVRDFGAVGDGRTPNRDAFDRAVDSLTAKGGGIVYVPPGRYVFTPPAPPSPHYWRKGLSNIHFVGEGESSIIVFEHSPITAVDDYTPKHGFVQGWAFPEVRNISIRALSFTWTPFALMRDSNPWYSIVLDAGEGAQFIGVQIDGGQPGLWIPEGRDKWVVDCVVRNTSADAIHFEGATDSVGAYNYVENSGDDALANFTNTFRTPDTSQSGNVRFAYNTIIFVGWGRGLTFGGSDQTIEHNWVEAQVEAGIYTDVGVFAGAPTAPLYNAIARDNTLIRNNLAQREDNTFYRFGTGGYQGSISVRDGIRGMRIERNKIFGSGVHGMTFGIEDWRPLDGEDIVIADNRLEREMGAGIRFISTASADQVQISDNDILDTGAASVLVEGNLQNVSTAENDVTVLPTVTGTVVGDFSGFTQVDDEPEYFDVYHEFRVADDESGWAEPPARSAHAGTTYVADVRKFGARGNGRTNDLEAFNRAIASIPDSGGVLKVPPGRYLLTPVPGEDSLPYTRVRHHLLIAGRNDIHIQGSGDTSVLVFTSPDHQGLRFVGTENSSVSNLTLELDRTPPLRHNRALLEFSAAKNCVVENVMVHRSSGPGILVDSSRLIAVRHNRIHRAGTFGIEIAASRQVFVEQNDVRKSRDSGIFLGWLGSIACAPQFIRIAGNKVVGTEEAAGIGLIGGDNVTVTGNEIADSYLAGIHIYSRCPNFPHRRIEVSENLLTNTNTGRLSFTPGAISLHSLQRGRRSAEILLVGNTVNKSPFAGIWVGGSTPIGSKFADMERLEVRDNTISNVGGAAIDISEEQRAHIDLLTIS
jgi:hypothetical protein